MVHLFHGLRFRLTLVIVGLAAGPLLIVGLIVGQLTFSSVGQQSLELQDEIADNVANRVGAFVSDRVDELLFLDQITRLGTRPLGEQRATLANLLFQRRVYQEFALLSTAGHETIRLSRTDVFLDLRSRSGEDQFVRPMTDGEPYFAPVRFDPIVREPLATIAVPLTDRRTGMIVSVLVADVRFRPVWSLLDRIGRPGNSEIYVIDGAGRIVAHRDPTVVLAENVVPLSKDGAVGEGLLGPDAVLATRTVSVGGARLITVVEVPRSQVFAPAVAGLRATLLVTAAAIAGAVGLVIVAGRSIVRPIERLADSARSVSQGHASQIELGASLRGVEARDELADLVSSFNQMSRSVHERESQLRQARDELESRVKKRTAELQGANERLQMEIDHRTRAESEVRAQRDRAQTYLDLAGVMIVALDRSGKVTLVNKKTSETLGMSEDEIVGQDWFGGFLPPSERESTRPVFDALMAGDLAVVENAENDVLTRDGRERLVAWHNRILTDDNGLIVGTLSAGEDVTDRRELEADRERLISQLESKNAELERFAYTVSHDLKSPLITIGGFLEYVGRAVERGDARQANADLSRIFDATRKMEQLLDAVLALSRIGGTMTGQQVDLGAIAYQAVETVAGRLELGNARVEIASGLPSVDGDPILLRQVLENLIDNAIKYIGEEKSPLVEIGCEMRAEDVVVSVRDNGSGIDTRHQERIFQLFHRLSQTVEGTGVGLATVKRIIDIHGGRVWVESEGHGTGCTFFFTLPTSGLAGNGA